MPKLHGIHSGENITETLLKLLNDYGIYNKISYVITNNTSNNNHTMIKVLKESLQQFGISFDQSQRLRCNSHIINLSVLAFLFDKHP